MAPLPSFNCQSASLSSDADQKRQDVRAAIANSYVQMSRLQDQMFGGADRYGSFGFMVYCVEPDFVDQAPVIRISDNPTAYYTKDHRGRVREYFEPYRVKPLDLITQFPEVEDTLKAKYGALLDEKWIEVVRWHDSTETSLVLLDPGIACTASPTSWARLWCEWSSARTSPATVLVASTTT